MGVKRLLLASFPTPFFGQFGERNSSDFDGTAADFLLLETYGPGSCTFVLRSSCSFVEKIEVTSLMFLMTCNFASLVHELHLLGVSVYNISFLP